MCGITGICGFSDANLLVRMTDRLTHRGPDAVGYFSSAQASLGNRRLSILDPARGDQPTCSRDKKIWVIFNGEIYNYRSIRKQHLPEYDFQTTCDTEIIAPLYQKYGIDMVNHLHGMFAMALWDTDQQVLYLIRDRIGIKPIYYSQIGSKFLFASEPKGILVHDIVSKEIDPTAVDAYLDLLYIPSPLSVYRSIKQVPPGCWLKWHAGEIEVQSYWQPDFHVQRNLSMAESMEIIDPLLKDAILSHTISDVPLGVFLSGGVDSSTIVSVLSQHTSNPIKTFSIGFDPEGESYEERPAARLVSEYYKTDHHELEISYDLTENLSAMVQGFDEPFGNPTALLTYELSRFARRNVTVALSGDGGDELFGGYPRYRGILWSDWLSWLPKAGLSLPLRWFRGKESATANDNRRRFRELLEGTSLPIDERYELWVGYCNTVERDRLVTPEFLRTIHQHGRIFPIRKSFQSHPDLNSLTQSMRCDLMTFLPENILRYTDRMSMAHGLEVRVPYLHHPLVEAMSRIPSQHKVGLFSTKRILRKLMKGSLPEPVLSRKKMGFNPPMGQWLKRKNVSLVPEFLSEKQIVKRGFFKPEEIRRMVHEHQSGIRDHGLRLWSLVVFEAWYQSYIDA